MAIGTDNIIAEYSITAEFSEGDPAYDWIINFIVRLLVHTKVFCSLTRRQTQEKVWRRSRDFRVSAKSSRRRWGISSASGMEAQAIESAEYVPTYDLPQIFWWKLYWIEIKRSKPHVVSVQPFGPGGGTAGASIFLT